jgi:hypothetical protein
MHYQEHSHFRYDWIVPAGSRVLSACMSCETAFDFTPFITAGMRGRETKGEAEEGEAEGREAGLGVGLRVHRLPCSEVLQRR